MFCVEYQRPKLDRKDLRYGTPETKEITEEQYRRGQKVFKERDCLMDEQREHARRMSWIAFFFAPFLGCSLAYVLLYFDQLWLAALTLFVMLTTCIVIRKAAKRAVLRRERTENNYHLFITSALADSQLWNVRVLRLFVAKQDSLPNQRQDSK